jgi:hypothetical protein
LLAPFQGDILGLSAKRRRGPISRAQTGQYRGGV